MIRIGVLSDIHFGENAREDATELRLPTEKIGGATQNICDGAVEIMKKMNVNYIFLAGDQTSFGSPEEFYYCEKKVHEMAKKVGVEQKHVLWCVGNHDNDWSITKIFHERYKDVAPEIKEIAKAKYSQISASVARENTVNHPKFTDEGPLPINGVYEDAEMIVFVLNSSSKCTEHKVIEHGELTGLQLAWLKERLESYGQDNRWKIVMLHHHPFNYSYPMIAHDISFLSEGSEFCDLVGENGVNLVVHGHRHHPRCITERQTNWEFPVTFICSGSFSVGVEQRNKGEIPNCFHIIELSDTVGELKLFSYEYSMASGWRKVKEYREELPIDGEMYLGKMFDSSVTDNAIEKLFSFGGNYHVWKWNELEEPLLYMRSNLLEEKIKHSKWYNRYEIKISHLENIMIIKK